MFSGSTNAKRTHVLLSTIRLLVPLVGFVICASSFAHGSVFEHPTAAYRLALPDAWSASTSIDAAGLPRTTLTHGEHGRFTLYALRVPGLSTLSLDAVEPYAIRLATADAGVMSMKQGHDQAADPRLKIGAFDSHQVKLSGNGTEGMVAFAISNGYLYVATTQGNSGQSRESVAAFAGVLSGLTVPEVKPEFAPRPEKSETLEMAAAKVKASVPRVGVLLRELSKDSDKPRIIEKGHGSGAIVSANGYVLTNRHVVEEELAEDSDGKPIFRSSYDPVILTWDDDTKLPPTLADVVAISDTYDLALLKLRGNRSDWQALPLVNPALIREGQKIMVAGWPELDKHSEAVFTVNEGALTSTKAKVAGLDAYTTSAMTYQGNSGGPFYSLDLDGVIGILYRGLTNDGLGFESINACGSVPIGRILEEFPQLLPGNDLTRFSVNRAVCFLDEGRFAAALIESDGVLRADPQSSKAALVKYRALLRQGAPAFVIEPIFEQIAPEDQKIAALWRARSCLEATDWNGMATALATWESLVGLNEAPDPIALLKPGRSAKQSRMPDMQWLEYNRLKAYQNASTGLGGLHYAAQKLGGEFSAEAEVLSAVNEIRQWMLDKQITEFPAREADRPDKERLMQWTKKLEAGYTQWPASPELAFLYLVYLRAMCGDTEPADETYTQLLKCDRHDQFFLQNLWHYAVLRKKPELAFALLQICGVGKNPGGALLAGLTSELVADKLKKQIDDQAVTEEELNWLLALAIRRDLVPKETKPANLVTELSAFAARSRKRAVLTVERSPLVFEYPDLQAARALLPKSLIRRDDWWGPWAYFYDGLQWNRK